ncbi:P2X purinoceptor 4-like isoform X1 [Argiope bruennichi]|uniref:P2X purinoceptor 4 like protein n=1 Tax=Argiope bruennichi TaxID=94029 RepID=A0A8T0FMQ0_ARGBR|nr:P2X purinoceptor 4-like isoform X1 [Argiope bruennichi]KAF8791792.1 P2X purinoceptor 4 like protein [Argiope bruennichi]
MTSSKFNTFFLGLFEYYTPKIVLIKNIKVGILNRFVQLAIISYIIGYAIIYNKGYQDFSTIESSVTSKVKGIAYTNYSESEFNDLIPNIDVYRRIWDTADYIVPPSENNAFFVITNIVITANQTQGQCPEDPEVSKCSSDRNCIPGTSIITGNGVYTGKCVTSDQNSTLKVCEIYGWCPVERDINPLKDNRALLSSTKNFTVLIKNFVDFPKFKIRRRNIPDYYDDKYLKHCNYHPVDDPLCPIFVLKDIVPGNYDEIAVKGAAMAIIIDWQCDFDYSESKCYPKYQFRRLDENSPISPGLNFRYAHYYGNSERTLYKAYGIKFIVMTQGRGGKFSIVPLLLNIGSGLGLLAVATILCDIVVLYIVKKKYLYKSVKYQSVAEGTENNNLQSIKKAGAE